MYDFCVLGLGYVGLPLVKEAVRSGLKGCGFDVAEAVVRSINAGRSHVDDLSDRDVAELLEAGFRATSDPSALAECDVIVICVPTPLAAGGGPDLAAVCGAAELVAQHLRPGSCVILESTTWPGTTEEVVQPILERSGLRASRDFDLAFSPERIDPGNPTFGVKNTPKVVGGISAHSAGRAASFYEKFIDTVIRAKGTREAEMAKLLENTYRQVNIALVNEMAKFSHDLDIDIWDVIRCASTKPFGFQPFRPGHGVGGHCIPIDPSYLSHRVQAELGYPFRFVELAQEVNRSMPAYVARRAQDLLNDHAKPVRGARVLLLGVTYKAGIADQRESPANPLAEALVRLGASVDFYDPFVEQWSLASGDLVRVKDLRSALDASDIIVHLQPHEDYPSEILENLPIPVLDTRGELDGPLVSRL